MAGHDAHPGATAALPPTGASSARPRSHALPLALFFLAYLLGAGFAHWLSLYPDTGIAMWPPAGVYLAALLLVPRRRWPWWVAAALAAEITANVAWFGNPPVVAVLLNAANALCALAGASLLLRIEPAVARLASLRSVLLLVVVGALVAPLVAATVGAATLAGFQGQPFAHAWLLWWIGDATGSVLAAPAALVAVQTWRERERVAPRQAAEAALVALAVGTIAVVAFSGVLPLAYIVMPPLLWAAVRFEFRGAVASLVLVALIAAFYTVRGSGPFAGETQWQPQKYVMLQLFLAIAGVTTLVVAAASRQHRRARSALEAALDDLERRVTERTAELSASERRFRAMADGLPLMVWVHDAEGRQAFVNRTFCEFFGVDRDNMRDERWRTLLHPDDEARYGEAFVAAVRARAPFHAEVRVRNAHDEWRWIESWGRPHFDQSGAFAGHIGSSADITERKAAEQALRATAASLARERERLGVALRAGALGVYEWSVREGVVWWSPETYALYGVDPATFTPGVESVTALIHPDDREAFWRKSAEQVARREVFVHEYRIVRPDGAVRWIFNRSHAALDAQGNAERITGVASDVTERRLAEDALRDKDARLRVALEASSIGLWSWDRESDRAEWSPEFYRIFGVPAGTVASRERTFLPLVHPDDRERVRGAFQRALESRSVYEAEYRLAASGGDATWIYDRGRVVLDGDGEVRGMVGAVSDVTTRKQYEQALAEASRAKDDFLAMLAHELRNPLAPIRNAADLIRLVEHGEPALAQAREMIERQVAHMVRLVDDLLDVSRIARGKLRLQRGPVDVNAVVRHVVESHRPQLEARGHALAVSLPGGRMMVEADFTRLAQAVGNLVANAAKYTDPGGRIALAAEEGRVEGRPFAIVRVRDNGRGIAPEALGHLFEMFYQAESLHDRAEGGLGIGLALVKRLVELQGGSVEARSEGRGRGSEFVIRLPLLAPAIEPVRTAQVPALPPARAQRVLVVDDNRDAADSTAMLLRLDGHEVVTAYDGREAVAVALRERPSAVLLDLGLPSLNGYQACRAMREGGLADALIVAVTGHGQDQDQRAAAEAGFDAHRVKPVELAALRSLLAAGRAPAPPPG